jgi:hypothetical protein
MLDINNLDKEVTQTIQSFTDEQLEEWLDA